MTEIKANELGQRPDHIVTGLDELAETVANVRIA